MKITVECNCGNKMETVINDDASWWNVIGSISIIPSIDHVSITCKKCGKEIQISQ